MDALRIAVVIGSTRPGRRGPDVARWVYEHTTRRDGVQVELLDLVDYALPVLDEPLPAAWGEYSLPHTHAWAASVATVDAFVIVTPEYNRSIPGGLKNAIDFLYAEWHDKAAGIVTYGIDAGGARAGEHLRTVLGELRVAVVRSTVALDRSAEVGDTDFTPHERRSAQLDELLDQLIRWGGALRTLR